MIFYIVYFNSLLTDILILNIVKLGYSVLIYLQYEMAKCN